MSYRTHVSRCLLLALLTAACHSAGSEEVESSSNIESPESIDVAPAPHEFAAEEHYLDALEADYEANSRRVVPRDSFDVLNDPLLVPAGAAASVRPDEYVLGFAHGDEAKAYPIGALGKSELVNDTCGGIPIAASW